MFNLPQSTFGRRSFLRFSALSVAAGSFLMNPISKAVAQAVKEIEPFYPKRRLKVTSDFYGLTFS
ncbi:hypothetical protein [Parasutterella excrementihominis]|uniref:hypothetical protein n=1 Tax=Parasutterella excrementihominis TaxID=487175 RepID=UPI003A907E0E